MDIRTYLRAYPLIESPELWENFVKIPYDKEYVKSSMTVAIDIFRRRCSKKVLKKRERLKRDDIDEERRNA